MEYIVKGRIMIQSRPPIYLSDGDIIELDSIEGLEEYVEPFIITPEEREENVRLLEEIYQDVAASPSLLKKSVKRKKKK